MQEFEIDGEIFTFYNFDTIEANNMVAAAVMRAQADLIEHGWSQGIVVHPEDAVNVLMDSDGNVAAFMVFSDFGSLERAINLSWVALKHRRRGLHTWLFNNLVTDATDLGFVRIVRGHHKNNVASSQAQEKQGSYVQTYRGDFIYRRTDLATQ